MRVQTVVICDKRAETLSLKNTSTTTAAERQIARRDERLALDPRV